MEFPTIPLIALILLSGLAIYQFIVFPLFLSPLSKIPPAHWSAPFSALWILNKRRQETETPAIHAAHLRRGPIVRIAPNEISVNSVDGGIRTIYAGGYEKGDWYRNVFNNYGVEPMFSMSEHGRHSRRKRMLSNIYAKSTLQASKSMDTITHILLNDRLVPKLRELAKGREPVEFYYLFCAITLDFVAGYVFGLKNGSNILNDAEHGRKFFRDYKARQRHTFWPQDMPRFTEFMAKIRLEWLILPSWVSKANRDIEAWLLNMCDRAEATVMKAETEGEKGRIEDWPTVYVQLRNALLKERSQGKAEEVSVEEMIRRQRLEVASEMLDHTLAGFDTSSITLTFLAWELSRPENADWQKKLHVEVAGLNGRRDAKEIDNLPILHAILMETLRLHAAIPGNQPRVTPANASLGDAKSPVNNLPANVRVQSQAWSLHRNPDVFPDPESWNPGRWLDSSEQQLREMHRWFWAFGSGGRMCVGSNLAILDMKAIITGIWAEFSTTEVDCKGMMHNGGYVAEPKGKDGRYCLLKVEDLETKG